MLISRYIKAYIILRRSVKACENKHCNGSLYLWPKNLFKHNIVCAERTFLPTSCNRYMHIYRIPPVNVVDDCRISKCTKKSRISNVK